MSTAPEITSIKAGQLVMLTHGEYSDYVPHGVGRATRDFVPQDLYTAWDAYRALTNTRPSEDLFASWALLRSGFLAEEDTVELHIGDYSDPTLSDGNERAKDYLAKLT